MSEKYYRLTKVKRHSDKPTHVQVGATMTGYLKEDHLPKENYPFIFSSDFGFGRGITTSAVKEVETNVEPGITFITTRTSIYKLEEIEE